MEIEKRNKLATLIFDIKDSIKDEQYKQLMETLGKKEAEPNLENIRLVKLYFIHYEVHERGDHLNDCEIDTLDEAECDCCRKEFCQERLTSTVKTRILEVYGEGNDSSNRPESDISNGRIHTWFLNHLIKAVNRYKNIDSENITEVNHYRELWLTDKSWIQPLKYTVLDKKEN